MEKDYKIWITYHKDDLVNEFNLKEDSNHILFPVHKSIEGENINYLNPIYSEICTLYYVWKNQIKSDYIGFNHYRRIFKVSKFPKENECQVYEIKFLKRGVYRQYKKVHNYKDLDIIINILDNKYGKENPYSKYLKEQNILLTCNCFFMSWENFNRLCEFLFPILFEFSELIDCKNDIQKWREKAQKDFTKDIEYQMRIQGFIAERLVSSWIINNLNYYI